MMIDNAIREKERRQAYLERVQKQNNTEVKTTSILYATKPGHMILEDVDIFPSPRNSKI